MKKTISYLVVTTLIVGLFSCKKTTNQQASTPTVTINGNSTVALNGFSGAMLLNGGDSLVVGFTNTTTTDTITVIKQLSGDSATNYNYFYINLASNAPITTGTYTTSSSNVSSLYIGLQNNGILYLPYLPNPVVNSVTISAINGTSVSGTYSATIYKVVARNPFISDGTSIKVAGTFKANVL